MQGMILVPRSALWLVAIPLVAIACATTLDEAGEEIALIHADPRYDSLFPYYVELCAVSQIRARFTGYGGSPGHAAMYVKGACRSSDTEFPTLEVCGPEVDLSDPESGSGVSVNKMFRNVNWTAVPGKELFYYGDLEPDERLTKESAIATIYGAEQQGVFRGVEVHGSYEPPPGDEEALLFLAAAETLGTDFALNFGRTVFCSRLPLARRELEDVIGYLNGLNREYALGEADYNWSGYNDNCSHTLHNSLAAAGVWKHKSVRSYKLGQLANLSVPANEFADLAILSMTFPIEDFDEVYGDRTLRESLLERGWLPTRHGAMLEVIPIHQRNDLYDTRMRIFMLRSPFRRAKGRRVDSLFDEPRNTDLETNLVYFRGLYQGILEGRPVDWNDALEGDEREAARAVYYRYIEAQLADVNDKIERLGRVRSRPDARAADR